VKTLSFKDKETRERVEAVMMSKEEFVAHYFSIAIASVVLSLTAVAIPRQQLLTY